MRRYSNRIGIELLVVIALLLGTWCLETTQAQQNVAPTAKSLYQQALHEEEATGNLKAAIGLYQRVLAAMPDRGLTAQALLRMAECYQKLGDSESLKVYERIVREYTDQKDVATTARARLGTTAGNAGVATRQIWTGPKVDSSGTISPDGRLLSFTDWDTGDLAVHDLTTGQDRRLTNNKGIRRSDLEEYAAGSAFSRDGKQLAYGWRGPKLNPLGEETFEVRLVDLTGGKPRVLTSQPDIDFATVHDWSPDARLLAVHLIRAGSGQIGLVSTANGTVRVLKSTNWRGPSKIVFSSDGKYLAYDLPVSDDSDQRNIYVMSTDGQVETPLTVHPSNDRILGWDPNGKYLLFASDRSGLPGVWALPVADGKIQGPPELIKANVNLTSLGFTKSGGFYYSVLTSGRDIFVASLDFEAGKVLSQSSIVPQGYLGLNNSPQWSPDGKYLAYLSSKDSNSISRLTVLAIRSMETGKVRELRTDLSYILNNNYTRPLWSPDARSFFVAGADKKRRRGIYRIDAQQGHSIPVVMNLAQEYPVLRGVSPDGNTLFISRKGAESEGVILAAFDLQSGTERELLRLNALLDSPVSPDGRFLAVTTVHSDRSSSLLVIPVEGGEPRTLLRVSDPERLDGFVAWTPDGNSLVFRKFLGGAPRRQVWRVSVQGGVPRELGFDFLTGRTASIHPDGRQVAFTSIDAKVEVWVMENFLPALGKR